jgi:hypothetical protein
VNALARAASALRFALLCCAGCAQIDLVAVPLSARPDAGQDAGYDAGYDTGHDAGRDAGSDAGTDAGSPQRCPYREQTVRTAANGASVSLDASNASAFAWAICACNSMSSSSELHVDGFDSASAAYAADASSAPVIAARVGINQGLRLDDSASISGSLIAAGSDGINLGGDMLSVGGRLAVGGPLEGSTAHVRVAGNAQVAGRIELAALTVVGSLTQPSGAALNVSGEQLIGQQLTAAVSVAKPCGCDDSQLLDVSAIVQAGVTRAKPLAADAPIDDVDCSEFALAEHSVDTWHIRARSSAAIYVLGGLHVSRDFIVETSPGVRLDIFIEDELSVDGLLDLRGDTDSVRLYLGGAGTLPLAGGGELHGGLYAPRAELVLNAPLSLYGAAFLRRVAATAALAVHYDANVARTR